MVANSRFISHSVRCFIPLPIQTSNQTVFIQHSFYDLNCWQTKIRTREAGRLRTFGTNHIHQLFISFVEMIPVIIISLNDLNFDYWLVFFTFFSVEFEFISIWKLEREHFVTANINQMNDVPIDKILCILNDSNVARFAGDWILPRSTGEKKLSIAKARERKFNTNFWNVSLFIEFRFNLLDAACHRFGLCEDADHSRWMSSTTANDWH